MDYPQDFEIGGGTSGTSGAAWWEQTLQYVITSAANAKFNAPQTGNQQYLMTADGRLVPAGSAIGTVSGVNTQQAMPQWALFAFLGLGALLLVKVMK